MRHAATIAAFAVLFLQLVAQCCEANDAVYQRVKSSTVWIVRSDGASGSGVLIDADRRLVVTNAHVVGSHHSVAVFAPVYDNDGRIWKRDSYIADAARLGRLGYATTGQVVACSSVKDLAVLRLESNLAGLNEIAFSDHDPEPDDGLHVVGNPADRPLFSYSYGGTRYTGSHSWRFSDGQYLSADIIAFSSHIWFGNSGGPVANDRGELVGVVSAGSTTTGFAISRSEIKRLVNSIQWQKVFCIHNETRNIVYLAVRTSADGDWQQVSIAPGYYNIWWGDDIEEIDIRFDWSYAEGYQGADYRLQACHSLLGEGVSAVPTQGRQYQFLPVQGGLSLFAVQ